MNRRTKKSRVLVALVFQVIVLSSISVSPFASAFQQSEKPHIQTIKLVRHFPAPLIKTSDEYLTIHLADTQSFLTNMGQPVLPVSLQTLELPLGTRLHTIQCTIGPIEETSLSKQITPAAKPLPGARKNQMMQPVKDAAVYANNQFFPENWYTYKMGSGLNKESKHTTFLTIEFHPVRYNPVSNTVQSVRSIELEITYEESMETVVFADAYDLVIISYDRYAPFLSPLVAHKERHNIRTKLVTLRDIYNSGYFPVQGRDNPEKIKYFIKNAVEQWGVTYVMLVGDFRQMPARYTSLETDTGGFYEELQFVSDLYYADIYDAAVQFASWDSDGDGVYGEWPYPEFHPMEDTVDMSPDVYVGRLACMNAFEVGTMVLKIIDYEENTYGSDWFDTFIVCGGDTFDKSWENGTDYDEGEVATARALEYMTRFTPIKIWASLGNLQTLTIQEEISNGAGFVYFVGHGSPRNWATHENGDYQNWTEGLRNRDMTKLANRGKYPIVMVGGCHNSQFDVTPFNIIKGLLEEGLQGYFRFEETGFGSYWTSNWVPECWSWVFVKKFGGGAIASIGSTGYGGVNIGDENSNSIPDCVEGADGWFETQFFRLYNEEHIDFLGETYGQTVIEYVQNFPVYTDRYDAKIVETHVLFGDPSLKIGGYSS